MEFMSQEHVDAMNALLDGSAEVQAAAGEQARDYVLVYELTDGPDEGATVYWELRLGPDGTRFALTPNPAADLRFSGDWHTAVTAIARSRRGEQVDDAGLITAGDAEAVMAAVGRTFAVARGVATLDATFPV